jgi:acyl-CoA thioesterase-2
MAPPHTLPIVHRNPIEIRAAQWLPADLDTGQNVSEQRLWVRSATPLPADSATHAAAILFATDMTMGWAPWKRHGIHTKTPDMFAANLDHTVWFHRSVAADEWLVVSQRSPVATGGRSLCTAKVFNNSGALVATAAQEGVMRSAPKPAA